MVAPTLLTVSRDIQARISLRHCNSPTRLQHEAYSAKARRRAIPTVLTCQMNGSNERLVIGLYIPSLTHSCVRVRSFGYCTNTL